MPSIPTYTDDVDVDALGTTLMHEHIFVRIPDLQEFFPGFQGWDEATEIANARAHLGALNDLGIGTIVDLTAPALGRDVHRVARAVDGSGMQVVFCTGYYTCTTFPFQYRGPGKLVIDDPHGDFLVSLLARDIEEGIEDAGIRAGILECATDEPGETSDGKRVLRAVTRTRLRTGVPISTHTHALSRRGLEQQRIFRQEGVDLGCVVIGHCNETTDLGYLEQLVDNASYPGWDECGLGIVLGLDEQVDTLAELCRRGYADRIVLSHDRHCTSDWFPEDRVGETAPQRTYDYVYSGVLPGLLEHGITEDQVEQMLLRHNPRDIFSGGAADRTPAADPMQEPTR
ncbi:phosphotriesterase family protein [Qaidamihabitans albus]|uniref:phosphotriesterase family protein n=1 Tax=Qaidamihabitans albus TaxID=2795733 RepID=UPI0018F1290A|nr:phosphotriesterase-related protein [Qaidamihabitans albus]